jgi:ribosomal protein RSM22 (predicted rRNA methylase)
MEDVLRSLEEKVLSLYKLNSLTKAFERISDRYRKGSGSFLQTPEERWVYLLTRLPATFSACLRVCQEMRARQKNLVIETFGDVGAGPGAGLWAAAQVFETLTKATLIEKDLDFLGMGKEIASFSSQEVVQQALWKCQDMTRIESFEPRDLIMLSYSMGEIPEHFWKELVPKLWQATQKVLVIIEPGTPAGYSRILKLRSMLLEMGGFLWAPCPHVGKCPLKEQDWCHFSVRVARTSLHRKLKSGALGYEDEKFCYLVFGKEICPAYSSRILRHPIQGSGHIQLTLCQSGEVHQRIISKRDKEKYREIKKLNWGDVIS